MIYLKYITQKEDVKYKGTRDSNKNLDIIQLILMPCGAQNDLRDIHAYRQHIHSVHSIYRFLN